MDNIIFASNIRELRKANGFTMIELAKRCGIDKSTVSKWEKHGMVPRDKTLTKLEEIFKVDRYALITKSNANANNSLYYTVQAAANVLGKHPETIRRYIRDGLLEAHKACNKEGYIITKKSMELFMTHRFPEKDHAKQIDGLKKIREYHVKSIKEIDELLKYL